MFVREVLGYGIEAFAKRAAIRLTCHIFTAKGKTAHCGAAIKVRRFWWEKSGVNAATFSSATAARLLHSF